MFRVTRIQYLGISNDQLSISRDLVLLEGNVPSLGVCSVPRRSRDDHYHCVFLTGSVHRERKESGRGEKFVISHIYLLNYFL